MHIILAILFLSLWLIPSNGFAQSSDAQQRTREIIESLSKTKYQFRAQRGVSKEKYMSIRSEPVIKKNIVDYSGVYEVPGLGYSLEIKVTNTGDIEAAGYESNDGNAQQRRRFTFRSAKIDGALLSATKVYDDGNTETFEGVFINKTDVEGTSPTQIERQSTAFGLGVAGVKLKTASGVNLDRLFYQKK